MYQIVIADDEATIRNGLSQLIASYQMGLTVAALAGDGQEALDAVQRFRPQLLLIDINMPRMNGLEAIRQIRRLDPDMKILILSGYDDFSYAQQAMEYGVFTYLLKPVDFRKFRGVLQSAMDAYGRRAWELSRLKEEGALPPSDTDLPGRLMQYLQLSHTENTLTLQTAAEHFHVSPSYVTKIVRQKTGVPFTDYVNRLRIISAKALLNDRKTWLTVGEIAEAVGYSSQNYFCRVFKSETGMTPNQWRSHGESL